jgi:hypothetical protein
MMKEMNISGQGSEWGSLYGRVNAVVFKKCDAAYGFYHDVCYLDPYRKMKYNNLTISDNKEDVHV